MLSQHKLLYKNKLAKSQLKLSDERLSEPHYESDQIDVKFRYLWILGIRYAVVDVSLVLHSGR